MTDRSELFDIIKKKIAEKTHAKNVGRGRIADFLGINPGRVRAWETGQRPSSDDLEILSVKLGFSPAWLLLGKGEVFMQAEEKQPVAEAKTTKETPQVADPISLRLETATRLLKEAGASPETIQQAIMKILDSPNEPHTQAEETISTPAFANDRDRSIKQP